MKAVISSTYDDQYLFFIPLVTYLWNKLGVDVICFTPRWGTKEQVKNMIVRKAIENMKCDIFYFDCPPHKMATYTQCSRLYAGSLGLPEEEILLTSDIDMAVFKIPERWCDDGFSITGCDLVPPLQYPMCYISAPAKDWRAVFGDEPYQQKLDQLLGEIEGQEFRGNYWSKDQEEAFNKIGGYAQTGYMQYNYRARPGTQFADHRVDRDDINWRSYLGPDLMDAHLWRPGYSEENFPKILELLQTQYPEENFQWLIDYRNEYIKLL